MEAERKHVSAVQFAPPEKRRESVATGSDVKNMGNIEAKRWEFSRGILRKQKVVEENSQKFET